MLRELKKRGINVVIVHKIDRLARNTHDDYEINTAIAAANARLVSVSEHIDDTPAGRLNYTIQAGVGFLAVSSGFGDQLMIEWCGPGVAG
jgi:DNA invertase Pin-like site-specific DNA recombinase